MSSKRTHSVGGSSATVIVVDSDSEDNGNGEDKDAQSDIAGINGEFTIPKHDSSQASIRITKNNGSNSSAAGWSPKLHCTKKALIRRLKAPTDVNVLFKLSFLNGNRSKEFRHLAHWNNPMYTTSLRCLLAQPGLVASVQFNYVSYLQVYSMCGSL